MNEPVRSDAQIETAIQAAGADRAPRVTPATIAALKESVFCITHHFPGTTLTVAVATLPDGFVVGTGFSRPISAANFDPEVGRDIAAKNAMAAAGEKLWELEGYLLRDKLRAAV